MAPKEIINNVDNSISTPPLELIANLLTEAKDLQSTNPDASLELSERAYEKAALKNLDNLQIEALITSAITLKINNKPDAALKCALKAIAVIESEEIEHQSQKAYKLAAEIYVDLSDIEMAIDIFLKSLSLTSSNRYTTNDRIDITNNLGKLYARSGDLDNALHYFQVCLDLFDKHNYDIELKAGVINNIGTVYWQQSLSDKALEYLNESLKLKIEIGNPDTIARTYNNIGLVYESIGRYPKALENYQQSLPIIQKTGDLNAIACLLTNIGIVYQAICDFPKALNYFLKSLDHFKKCEDLVGEAQTLNNLGTVCLESSDYASALSYLERSLKLWDLIDDDYGKAITMKSIGGVFFQKHEYEKALEYYSSILPIVEKAQQFNTIANICGDIGEVYRKLENYPEALNYYKRCIEVAEEIDDLKALTEAYLGTGAIYAALEQVDLSLEFLNKSLKMSLEIGAKDFTYKAHFNLSKIYEGIGDLRPALDHLRMSQQISEQVFNEETDLNFQKQQAIHEVESAKQDSEIYRLETVELARANASLSDVVRDKKEILSIAAHDLKNPLAMILMAIGNLEEEITPMIPTSAMDKIKHIDSSAKRMLEIINQVLSSDAIESDNVILKAQEIDLRELTKEVVENYLASAKAKNINLKFTPPKLSSYVLSNYSATKQIIENLLSNAIKYSPFNKEIKVEILATDDKTKVIIDDQGPGISEEDQKKLFKKFTRLSAQPTNNENSTGLGLSIAKKLSDLMGCQLWCESTFGKGAAFIIQFPGHNNSKV